MSDWQNKVGNVLQTMGTALQPPDAATQFDPASLPTTRQPGYEKAAELAQTKAHQTVEEGHEQQRIDIDRQKTQAMVAFYKVRDQEALAKMGSKRDETGAIVPDPNSLAYRHQQGVEQHYQDQQEHYKDQYNLGLMKDELGRETNEIKKADIRARIAVTQQRINQRDAVNIRQWAAQQYAETGIINPQADQIFKQGGFVPGGQAQPGAAAQNIPMPQGKSQADVLAGITGQGAPTASPPAPQAAPSAAPPQPKKVAPKVAPPAPTATPGATPGTGNVNLYPGVKADIPPPGERALQRQGLKSLDKAVVGDQSFHLLEESWNKVQKTGNITGNDAMMALSAHVGSSLGQIPGIKPGRDLIEHHLKARPWDQELQAWYNQASSGGPVSKEQIENWYNTAVSARAERWQAAAKEAQAIGPTAVTQLERGMPRGMQLKMSFPDGKTYPISSERAVEMMTKYGGKTL